MGAEKHIITVRQVGKKFAYRFKRSLWYGFLDILGELLGKKARPRLRNGEFWALKDVSFQLQKGQCLAIVGPNGSGKSTLLKILSGLIKHDTGQFSINGSIGAMIELGAGFNPLLTGKENIYLNASLLGFTKQEIEAKYEDIVAFSELGEYLNMPVQNYSSGMRVRLGFSIAIQMRPDVLIIDEVLAVGDAEFKSKCFDALEELMGTMAVIIISHNMLQIDRLADEIIVLKNGQIQLQSRDIHQGIALYNSYVPEIAKKVIEGDITISNFTCTYQENKLQIRFNSHAKKDVDLFKIKINIVTSSFLRVASVWTDPLQMDSQTTRLVSCKIDALNLSPNTYYFTVNIWKANKNGKEQLISRYKGLDGFTIPGATLPHQAISYPKSLFQYDYI